MDPWRDTRNGTSGRSGRRIKSSPPWVGRSASLRPGHYLSQVTAGQRSAAPSPPGAAFERGEATGLPVVELARALAVVGLDLHIRAYPAGQPLRDTAHIQLLERMRVRLGPGVRWRTEVPLLLGNDQRAWDALMAVQQVRIGVEAETRARDAQGLQRRLALKQRDGSVEHVVLLLADTRHDRLFMRTCGEGFLAGFPIPGLVALRHLAAAEDPGGSAIILL